MERFDLLLECERGTSVPAVLWQPDGSDDRPVVLLGHGGSGQKASDRQQKFATWFAHAGITSLAIDGPFHGARAVADDGPGDYLDRVVRQGAAQVHEGMRDDWLETLAEVELAGHVDGQRVAFLGLSMGTRYGIAACAALGPRLRCAVIGKFGLTQTACLPAAIASPEVIVTAAQGLCAPVLQHVQWDDQVFPRSGQFDLFEILASPNKQLHARPGRHAETHPDDESLWRQYVSAYLSDR